MKGKQTNKQRQTERETIIVWLRSDVLVPTQISYNATCHTCMEYVPRRTPVSGIESCSLDYIFTN
jgi:ribosomal protein S19